MESSCWLDVISGLGLVFLVPLGKTVGGELGYHVFGLMNGRTLSNCLVISECGLYCKYFRSSFMCIRS